jgi:hypothetical protein
MIVTSLQEFPTTHAQHPIGHAPAIARERRD